MQSNLDEKIEEVDKLNENMEILQKQLIDMASQLETAKKESENAIREKITANKAKELAEQQMTSIEYEYEQHKVRASGRETELIQQLNELGYNEENNILQEKLNTMTEKAKSLEIELWQDKKKHIAEVESINCNMTAYQEKNQNLTKQLENLKTLQNDYDELSIQLVDCIQENDKLKSQFTAMNTTIDDLNKKINDLNSQLANQLSTDRTVNDLQTNLQQLGNDHTIELEKLMENHRMEIEKLKGEIDMFKKKYTDAFDDVLLLKKWVDERDVEISDVKTHYNELYTDFVQAEDDKIILQNIWKQCISTVDGVAKELEILRNQYVALQVNNAQQELNNLKLQKTICDYNDSINCTVNGSLYNEIASTSMVNATHQDTITDTPSKLPSKLEQPNDQYISQLDSIRARLKSILDNDVFLSSLETSRTSSPDIHEMIDTMGNDLK